MANDKLKIRITNDGSSTLSSKFENEHYHSVHGALSESLHVFIQNGLLQIHKKKISILEMGFGTGLNTLLTFIHKNKCKQINYHSIESDPIDSAMALKLNYLEQLKIEKLKDFFSEIHHCSWDEKHFLDHSFNFIKWKTTMQEVSFTEQYDLVYYDAFGPRVQPELWTEELFLKIFNSMNEEGVLVTYCAKGEVKRILKRVGFTVKSLPGPPGKREMTQAIKIG